MNFVGRPSLLDEEAGQGRAVRRRHAQPAHRRLHRRTRSTPRASATPAAGTRYNDRARRRRTARPGRRRPARLHRASTPAPARSSSHRRSGAGRVDLQDEARGTADAPARARHRPRNPAGRQGVPGSADVRRRLRAVSARRTTQAPRAGHRRRRRHVTWPASTRCSRSTAASATASCPATWWRSSIAARRSATASAAARTG